MPQRGGKTFIRQPPRGGWILRKRNVALPQHLEKARATSRLLYVVRMRNTDVDDWATLVKAGRLRQRMSQAALASAAGVARETVWRWETGRQKPENAEVVRRVASALLEDEARLMRAAKLALPAAADEPQIDPRLHGLDPKDPVVVAIMRANVDEEMRSLMFDRRREQLAEQRERDLREIEFWVNRERGRGTA